MTAEGRKYWHLWLVAFFLIGVVNLIGCARYKPQTEVVVELDPWSPCVPWALCQIGQVVCSEKNEPIILVRSGLDPAEKPFTLVHEKTHVSQMKGDCIGVRTRYRDNPAVRWEMELGAYCAEAKARIKSGIPAKEVIAQLTMILRTLYQATDEDIICNWR